MTDAAQPIGAETPDPARDAQAVPTRSLGRASALLASGTIVSRVLGFAKTAVLAAAIGQTASSVADAFALSNQLPNNVYALVAGGLLSAVLIPQIVRASKGADGGQRYIDKVVTLGLVVFAAVTLIATLAAPFLVHVYASSAAHSRGGHGFSGQSVVLATVFAYWCLPQIFFYAVYSLLSEILNARQVFGPFTWAPVLNNVIGVLGLLVFLVAFGTGNTHVGEWSTAKTVVLAGTTTLGVVVQAVFLLFFWRRAGLTYRPDFAWRGVGLGSTGRAAGWMFALILVTQLAGIVQSRAASLGSGAGASNAVISNAWLLFFLPHGIVTVSIATAYFTSMTKHADRGDVRAVRNNLSDSMRTIGMFIVFATIALAVLAYPFARFYEQSFHDVGEMASVILAYLPGLVFFSMLFLLQRVFFAFHDQRTVFFLQLIQSGIFVVAVLLCTVFVDPDHIAIAIAVVTSVAGTAQTIVALRLVHTKLGGLDGRWVTRRHVQYLVFSVVAGLVGLAVVSGMGGYHEGGFAVSGRIQAIFTVIVGGAVMAGVYFVLLTAARIPELSAMTRPVLRRLRRR
jgi:putative peptidoglycan lipid II flippase